MLFQFISSQLMKMVKKEASAYSPSLRISGSRPQNAMCSKCIKVCAECMKLKQEITELRKKLKWFKKPQTKTTQSLCSHMENLNFK